MDQFEAVAPGSVRVVQVSEQDIESMLLANRHGHIACTQGGECLAGLRQSVRQGLAAEGETAILDATAHSLKFSGFCDMYFTNSSPEYGVTPKAELANAPELLISPEQKTVLTLEEPTKAAADAVVARLGLHSRARRPALASIASGSSRTGAVVNGPR